MHDARNDEMVKLAFLEQERKDLAQFNAIGVHEKPAKMSPEEWSHQEKVRRREEKDARQKILRDAGERAGVPAVAQGPTFTKGEEVEIKGLTFNVRGIGRKEITFRLANARTIDSPQPEAGG